MSHPQALLSFLGASHLISTYGLLGVFVIIFAETGLLVGFFLPGDSLLVLAGAYSATAKPGHPHLNLAALLIGVSIAAVLGGHVGYLIGRKAGPPLFARPDSRLFKQVYVERTGEFLEKYGQTRAVLLARVIPVIRTFINPVVGVIRMPARSFVVANVIGGVVWAISVTIVGYALGSAVNIDSYLLPIIAVVIVASLVPIALEARKQRRATLARRADERV